MGCKQSRSIPYGGDLQVMWTQNPEIPGIFDLVSLLLAVNKIGRFLSVALLAKSPQIIAWVLNII